MQAYMRMPLWQDFHIRWIGTHIDRSAILKLIYAISGFFSFLCHVWAYDIIHFHVSTSSSAMRKYLFHKIAKALHKKVVVHLHIGNQFDDQLRSRLGAKAYQSLFERADAVVVLSKNIQKRLQELYQLGDRVKVIYNPCSKVEDVHYQSDRYEILYAGILNENKGYAILLKAFARLSADYPQWKINLAGNGELEQALRLAQSLGITDQVNLLGWVSGKNKEQLFRRASIYCLASYNEGFPMAVLDALSHGLPVIVTTVGGLPDVLHDGENAFLFTPGDVEQLANKLGKLIKDEALRKNMSERSLDLAGGELSASHINQQITELYSSLYP